MDLVPCRERQLRQTRRTQPLPGINSAFSDSIWTFSCSSEVDREPDFIGCDAGSTDSGPGSLGTGVPAQPRQGIKRDLRIGLLAAVRRRIPLLVGSAGSGGGDANLAAVVEVVREIAREEGRRRLRRLPHKGPD